MSPSTAAGRSGRERTTRSELPVAIRAGVLNLGIEGMMFAGAFWGFAAAYHSGSLLVGLLAAVAVGAASAVVLGLLALGLNSFAMSYGVVYWAEQSLPSGLTSILWATFPLWTVVLGRWFLPDERSTAARLFGA